MRKTAAIGVLLASLMSSVAPVTAQPARFADASQRFVRDVQFETARALTDGSGVLVRWQMTSETAVAGYNVYRIDDGSRRKVNPSLLAGSAARFGDRVAYGEVYQFFDPNGTPGARYLVEGKRMDASEFVSSPIGTAEVKSLEAGVGISSDAFRKAASSESSSVEHRTAVQNAELAHLVSAYAQQPDSENQRVIASKAAAKIAVNQDGFYRVSSGELTAANFPIASDSSKWRLFTNGVEQAIVIAPDRSYIEFYGRGVDTPETTTRIYYLVADTVPGKRIGTKVLRNVPGSPLARNFSVVAEKKERKEMSSQLFNGDEENFVGNVFDTWTRVRFNLSGVDHSEPAASVKTFYYGFADRAHQVQANVNGFDLPIVGESGRVQYSLTASVPTEHLVDGENVLEASASTPGDYNFFDKIQVTYKRKYTAESGQISFSTPGSKRVDVSEFASSDIRVLDTTFEGNPVLLSNIGIDEGEAGFVARIPSTRAMVGYAFENSAILHPASVTPNTPSTLSLRTNRADMLIVSYSAPSFMVAAGNWASYRRSAAGGGLTTEVIDIADIYDEFNYGMLSADAIKSFLSYASTQWASGPKYVLLIGDYTYDPRVYEGMGDFNYIPSRTKTMIAEEAWSDEALGDFDGDNVSLIPIGRIPARTASQITTALNKTVAFESGQLSFTRGALFTHDAPLGYNFQAMTQQLVQRLPQGMPVNTVGAAEADAPARVLAKFNEGKYLVNYSGHGASRLWANSVFFNVDAVPMLTNRNNLSVVTMLSCLGGYFLSTTQDSMSDALLFSDNGGAVAAWASTSETTPDVQSVMGYKFLDELAGNNVTRIGDMIRIAKQAIPFGADVRSSWVLIGDPALKMR